MELLKPFLAKGDSVGLLNSISFSHGSINGQKTRLYNSCVCFFSIAIIALVRQYSNASVEGCNFRLTFVLEHGFYCSQFTKLMCTMYTSIYFNQCTADHLTQCSIIRM